MKERLAATGGNKPGIVTAAVPLSLYRQYAGIRPAMLSEYNRLFSLLGYDAGLPVRQRHRIYLPLSGAGLIGIKDQEHKPGPLVQEFLTRFSVHGFRLITGEIDVYLPSRHPDLAALGIRSRFVQLPPFLSGIRITDIKTLPLGFTTHELSSLQGSTDIVFTFKNSNDRRLLTGLLPRFPRLLQNIDPRSLHLVFVSEKLASYRTLVRDAISNVTLARRPLDTEFLTAQYKTFPVPEAYVPQVVRRLSQRLEVIGSNRLISPKPTLAFISRICTRIFRLPLIDRYRDPGTPSWIVNPDPLQQEFLKDHQDVSPSR